MKEQNMPLSAIAEILRVNRSLLQYYVVTGLITSSISFPKSKVRLFNVKKVVNIYRKTKKLQAQGYKISDILAKNIHKI